MEGPELTVTGSGKLLLHPSTPPVPPREPETAPSEPRLRQSAEMELLPLQGLESGVLILRHSLLRAMDHPGLTGCADPPLGLPSSPHPESPGGQGRTKPADIGNLAWGHGTSWGPA